MPTFGLRPDDIVRDSRGDAMIDLKQTFYATRADAEAQVNPLGSTTSAKDGKWQFTNTASGVFGRDPEGNIRFYDSEEPKLSVSTASSTYARPKGGTVVIWGDSFTSRTDGSSGSSVFRSTQGYWTWADVLSRHRLDLLKNAGVHGEGTAQILSRFDADVKAYSPAWVVIAGGNNDVAGDIGAAAIQANLTQMIDKVIGIGAQAIVATIPPRNSLTTAQRQVQVQVNQWLRDTIPTKRGCYLVDFWQPLLDPANGGLLTSLHAGDGIHPNGVGAARLGRAVADVLNANAPARELLNHSIDNPLMLTTNPYLTGTGGTLGTGVTGSVATGWTVDSQTGSAITATASKVARTDGKPGEWQQISLTSGVGVKLTQNEDGVNTDWIPGVTQVYAMCEFETDADFALTSSSGRFDLNINTINTSFAGQGDISDLRWVGGDAWAAEGRPVSGVLRTPVFTIPATANKRIIPGVSFQGSGTFRIGRFALYKVA